MPIKVTHEDKEIEVYTADEVTARETSAVKAKEDEFGKTKSQLDADLAEARKALDERSGEFKQFRKLNDDQVKKLSLAEKTIYENGLALQEEKEKNNKREKEIYEGNINTVLKSKAGGDEKVAKKMREIWDVIGIDAKTPEEIERKTAMVIGAIKTTEPDLIASVAGFGGSASVPNKGNDEKGFGETDKGKAAAADLGLMMEPPKKK